MGKNNEWEIRRTVYFIRLFDWLIDVDIVARNIPQFRPLRFSSLGCLQIASHSRLGTLPRDVYFCLPNQILYLLHAKRSELFISIFLTYSLTISLCARMILSIAIYFCFTASTVSAPKQVQKRHRGQTKKIKNIHLVCYLSSCVKWWFWNEHAASISEWV